MATAAMRKGDRVSDFDDLRRRIADTDAKLPKRLAQAAEYALNQPDEIAFGTAASIASAAGVQPSTLVRLARHLGYGGFSDMQTVFRERMRTRASSYEERLEQLERGTGSEALETSVVNGFLEAAQDSLLALNSNLDRVALRTAIKTLASAETIHLVGNRRVYPLTAHLSYMFSRLKIRNQIVNSPNSVEEEMISLAGTGDAVIACSFPPYAEETVRHVTMFTARNIPVVAITDTALSPIAAKAACWIEISETDFSGFRPLAAPMVLASALPVAVAEKRRQK